MMVQGVKTMSSGVPVAVVHSRHCRFPDRFCGPVSALHPTHLASSPFVLDAWLIVAHKVSR